MTTVTHSPVIVTCIVLYLAACFFIGIWALRRTHSSADFFVAGKSLGLIVLAVASFSNIMSGFGFVGGPGLVYESGMSSAWIRTFAPSGVGARWRTFTRTPAMIQFMEMTAGKLIRPQSFP